MSKIVIELHGDFPEHPADKAEILKSLMSQMEEIHYASSCRPFSETDVRMISRAKVGGKELSLARYLSSDMSLAGFWKRKKDGLPESFDE